MSNFRTNPRGRALRLVTSEDESEKRFVCLACRWRSDDRFLMCLGCGALDSCADSETSDEDEPVRASRDRALNARFIEARKVSFVPTGRPAWDKVLGGGAVAGASVIVKGRKGTGKSTSVLGVAMTIARELGGKVLYVTSEMPREHVRMLFDQSGLPPRELGRLFIQASGSTEDAVTDADLLEPAVVVWDSIQRMRVADRLGERELVDTVGEAIACGKRHGSTSFLISQVTKSGEVVGPSGLEHDVDVVLELRRTRTGRMVVSCPEKNRFAPTPARALEGSPRRRRRR